MESVMLLGHTNYYLNNIRREKIKHSLHKDFQTLCENGNPPTKFLLGDYLPRRNKKAEASWKLLFQSPQTTRFSSGSTFTNGQNQYPSNKGTKPTPGIRT